MGGAIDPGQLREAFDSLSIQAPGLLSVSYEMDVRGPQGTPQDLRRPLGKQETAHRTQA